MMQKYIIQYENLVYIITGVNVYGTCCKWNKRKYCTFFLIVG